MNGDAVVVGAVPDLDLRGRTVAVLGGDGREVEIARQAARAGAVVRTCGLPVTGDVPGTPASTVAEAVRDADVVICPVPLPAADGSLFAPHAPDPLVVNTATLRGVRPGAVLITGRASPQMAEAAQALHLRLREYEQEEDLMLLRAPAIAEGAIRVAIEHTEVTLHGHPCMVVGFGRIGPVLAATLRGLGARVTVAARNPAQLARAWAMGCAAVPLEALAERARDMCVIFNTAPARLFTREVLTRLDPQCLLIDLSGPPGAVDLAAAGELGVPVVWARGLGGRAPRTVGYSQWLGITRILATEWPP
ncbi:MAG: dipicolinate synthase subunit DpsA [Armatimonadota bacterium]|nr:dipicolinate synthase subunit DpsA [Armatimonadota bacterium]MDR7448284.1 dipicolinate synthase subunit DpsA [Armatimonadota bacterium]MDR7458314.1 dipicolinate synthase subunit DpsA [Armatimonadota bacterium]MDR7478383.1 dipicolinate synthase subunit DpsA [Armatimonadota bacterium]MDR7487317.1 dipicolinate synthase subunit DpsA [Armatimonadota bacterium]